MSTTIEFLAFLRAQQGAAYVWGAQGQEARADGSLWLDGKRLSASWEAWVNARETSAANASRAKAFIQKKLAAGAASISLYDCSGLVMRYLQNIAKLFPSDKNAAGLLAACREIPKSALFPGCLVFSHDGKKAHHVGVYLGEGLAVEAQGRDAGVVIRALGAGGASYWNRFGVLPFFEQEAPAAAARFARCSGGSVNARKGPGTTHEVIAVAHKGDPMLALPSDTPGWQQVALASNGAFVTGYMSEQYIDITKEAF